MRGRKMSMLYGAPMREDDVVVRFANGRLPDLTLRPAISAGAEC